MNKLLFLCIFLVFQASLLFSQTPWQEFVNEQKSKADVGDADAQGTLSILIQTQATSGSNEQAHSLAEKSATASSAFGFYALGRCYEIAVCTSMDESKAKELFSKSLPALKNLAEAGNAVAAFLTGASYEMGRGVVKNEPEAVKWYRKAAEQDYAVAQDILGSCYYSGQGVAKDRAEALKWYRKAADQGFANAQTRMGHFYFDGELVNKDEAQAMKWYRKAAEQGFADAEHWLGECYYIGSGVTMDKAESLKWYRKAADQGFAKAQMMMGHFYFDGELVNKDEAEAVKWYRKAAEQGFADAEYWLGECYYIGSGVTMDKAESLKWYRKAADQGFAKAQMMMGHVYHDGVLLNKDEAQAVKWYHKAAEQGYSDAYSKLGYSYAQGDGVSTNQEEAAKWYLKAAEQGDYYSQKNMAHRYFYGSGVKVSKATSEMWQRKASENLFKEISKASANFNPSSKGPKVKGLILGMPIPNAYDRIQAIFKEAFPDVEFVLASDKKDGDYIFSITVSNSVLGMTYPVVAFRGDAENGVKGFSFQSQLTEKAFNSADLNAAEFAKEFIDSYGIPELNVEKDIWVYKSDEGWQLDIDQKKNVVITTIASKSERKFD
jgi:TPR repeat protein